MEDKVWAPFQHRQPERYRERAKIRGGAAVLVAPKAFLESHRTEAAIFHGCMSIEAVIGWLRDAANSQTTGASRRQWRASLLEELMRRPTRLVVPDDEPTVAFTSFCATWFADHGGVAPPNERTCRTAGTGWLWFSSPRGLGYKASAWVRQDVAAVDLYVAGHGFTGDLDDFVRLLQKLPPLTGFVPTTDTAKKPNVVLRYTCAKVSPGDGKPELESERCASVIDALEACQGAAEWIAAHEPVLAVAARN